MRAKHFEFKAAYEAATKVNRTLYRKYNRDEFISLEDIQNAVQKSTGISIKVSRTSFSELCLHECANDYSMMRIKTHVNPATNCRERIAEIVVNTDYDAITQRFAVAHELGHIMCHSESINYKQIQDNNNFVISKYVHSDITRLMKQIDKCTYSLNEAVANIFAVLVLVPRKISISDVKKHDPAEFAKIYGVTEDAILSRMLLTWWNV